jgi:tRNA nucleotidyltransferase/poly(A) polymerase
LGRAPADWDLTTDARPDRIQSIFPRSIYENRFGTVVVRHRGTQYEITTFRRDATYTNHRHPDGIEFGRSIDEDLARRDFTVNAMAWGTDPAGGVAGVPGGVAGVPGGVDGVPGGVDGGARLVDPHGGRGDLERRLLRAVGDPDRRFNEDALRMIRAVRLAATLRFDVEPETMAAITRNAQLAAHLSGERIFSELLKLLAAELPSVGLRLMADTGLLAVIAPDLDRQRGIPQNKIAGEDLWGHTLRTVDATPNRPVVRLAALLHDVGKPDTISDGPFHGHEAVGARLAATFLSELHAPRELQERVAHLVRLHMFNYGPGWSDAAVRRFVRKVTPDGVEDLLALRAADNEGSGQPPETGGLPELAARIRTELASGFVLGRGQLEVDGNDLMVDLGLPRGPILGSILDYLTERVVSEPALNVKPVLLELAKGRILELQLVENRDR